MAQSNIATQQPQGRGPCPYANVPVLGGIYCAGWNVGGAAGVPTVGDVASGNADLGTMLADGMLAFVTLPFKLLGIESPSDFMWRAMLILFGIMLVGFGLAILAGQAAHEEAPEIEQGASTAAMAA